MNHEKRVAAHCDVDMWTQKLLAQATAHTWGKKQCPGPKRKKAPKPKLFSHVPVQASCGHCRKEWASNVAQKTFDSTWVSNCMTNTFCRDTLVQQWSKGSCSSMGYNVQHILSIHVQDANESWLRSLARAADLLALARL